MVESLLKPRLMFFQRGSCWEMLTSWKGMGHLRAD
jgi:hypothetical protein